MTLTLPGWTCPSCSGFNGSAKEVLAVCRACGAKRPRVDPVLVSPTGETVLPEAMVKELGTKIWFLRGKERWEAWSESELETVLAGAGR